MSAMSLKNPSQPGPEEEGELKIPQCSQERSGR